MHTVPHNKGEERRVVVMAVSHIYVCYDCKKSFTENEVVEFDLDEKLTAYKCKKCYENTKN